MYDARRYTDLVTLWIKGFPALHFEIQIRREQLEVLQVFISLFDVVSWVCFYVGDIFWCW